MKTPIRVWRFEDAPRRLQELSTNGGDEDWIAEVPPHLRNEWIAWMQEPFGCYCVDEYEHPTRPGWLVKIGCHS